MIYILTLVIKIDALHQPARALPNVTSEWSQKQFSDDLEEEYRFYRHDPILHQQGYLNQHWYLGYGKVILSLWTMWFDYPLPSSAA